MVCLEMSCRAQWLCLLLLLSYNFDVEVFQLVFVRT